METAYKIFIAVIIAAFLFLIWLVVDAQRTRELYYGCRDEGRPAHECWQIIRSE